MNFLPNEAKYKLLACKNIRFSSLFAAGDAKSEEKRMFSQANTIKKNYLFILQVCPGDDLQTLYSSEADVMDDPNSFRLLLKPDVELIINLTH